MAPPIPIPADLPQKAALTSPENPWPLHLLNAKISEYVARMSRLWVEGEILQLSRRPGARVQFFTLADLAEDASINCKIWSHALPEGLKSGSRVVICAKPDFWTGKGTLTLQVDEIRPVGLGDILARIEALKNRLAAEGLFSPERKQPLPFLPGKIGLICGRNTEAMHDVVVNASLRWPAVAFDVREVKVQGPGAVAEMIPQLESLDADPAIDVIVLARGGGSLEDLLPFSEEALLRAVAACRTPVVSAIGHEKDNPLLDYVADVRASTPTDAARRIVPDVAEERAGLAQALTRGRNAITARLDSAQVDLDALRSRPVMADPFVLVDARAEDVAGLRSWGRAYFERSLDFHSAELSSKISQLRTLSPLSTLQRGYAVLRKDDGSIIASVAQAVAPSSATAILSDGTLDIRVERLHSQERAVQGRHPGKDKE